MVLLTLSKKFHLYLIDASIIFAPSSLPHKKTINKCVVYKMNCVSFFHFCLDKPLHSQPVMESDVLEWKRCSGLGFYMSWQDRHPSLFCNVAHFWWRSFIQIHYDEPRTQPQAHIHKDFFFFTILSSYGCHTSLICDDLEYSVLNLLLLLLFLLPSFLVYLTN